MYETMVVDSWCWNMLDNYDKNIEFDDYDTMCEYVRSLSIVDRVMNIVILYWILVVPCTQCFMVRPNETWFVIGVYELESLIGRATQY